MTFDELGLNASRLIAGFCGGVVHAFVFRASTPMAVISSVLTGTLTANFLGLAASHYIGAWLGDGGSSFLVGLSAMAVCQALLAALETRIRRAAPAPPPPGEG